MSMPAEMQQVIDEGYAARLAQGDVRAASLFARLVAYRLNPTGVLSRPGWLRKGGGNNVDGYSVDAIVLNADPNDLHNVMDLVSGAEAPGARPMWGDTVPRRASDVWERPRPLTEAELSYLRGGATPTPTPIPRPPTPDELITLLPTRERAMRAGARIHAFYQAAEGLQRPEGLWIDGHPDWEGIGAWLFDVWLKAVIRGKTDDQAYADVVHEIHQSEEWRRKHPG